MFEKIFDSPARIQSLHESPGGQLLEIFAKELTKEGYKVMTIRRHIRAAELLIDWINREGIPISKLTEKLLGRFDLHLDQLLHFSCRHRLRLLGGVHLFLKHLRATAVIEGPFINVKTQNPVLLTEFCQWMRQQRGTTEHTLSVYSLSIKKFLKHHGEDPGEFDAQSLRGFVLEQNRKSEWATMKKCTTALRMFVRFLIAEGKCATGLDSAIPVIAHWRLSSLPRYVQPEEVEHIINSYSLNSPVGRRNRAILLLLARLGLRAGDIVKLRLGDIDWKGAGIYVSGKGRLQVRLPLTQEVGNAIVDYLQEGRPQTNSDVLFIRSVPPFCAFGSSSAISLIVSRAMLRSGVTCQSCGGAHVLRHSAATSMLRQGASLQDIAAILRHRSIETTKIYTKVDVNTLQQIAQPWPEVPIC